MKNSTARFGNLAAYKQGQFLVGIVEAVRDSCPSWECDQITCSHAMDLSIDPGVKMARNDMHKFLFLLLSMRPGGSRATHQALHVDAYSFESDFLAKTAHSLMGSLLYG